jgi:two-component system, OmpR family, sensor histidine kinase KdpD
MMSGDESMSNAGEAQRGRLKIFLGAAPGVGKTYQMLRAAQSSRHDGVDVVIGLIETHGRQDTEEQLRGLEVVPRKLVEYKEHVFEEMDIDALLERAPGLVIVDELAHSNVPGCRNAKRYLDVQELIKAGIDVFTTLNVQHIESLNDIVAKTIWTVVRETVPDSMLDLAEEIEVVDLSPADLIERLKQGKVNLSGLPGAATHNFFSQQNLASLRPLALQRAKKPPARRILVPFDGSPSALHAVQHIVSLARAGHRGTILLLNVQAPSARSSSPGAESSVQARTAGEAILDKASQLLDAQHIPYQCEVLAGLPPEAIAAAVERHQIDLIVMGSTGIGTLARLFLGSVAMAVVQESKVPVTLVK